MLNHAKIEAAIKRLSDGQGLVAAIKAGQRQRLSDGQGLVAAIKAGQRQRLSDGQGLMLAIMPSGSASWLLRVQSGGRRRDIGIGGYPAVSLSDARQKAREIRETVKAGGDPVAERRRPPVPTFEQAAAAALQCRSKAWRGSATARDWWASITNHCGDLLNRPVDSIASAEVVDLLTPVYAEHPSLAPTLRQRVRRVFGWASARGLITVNPAGEAIQDALPVTGHRPTHHKALEPEQVGPALAAVDTTPASESTRLCLHFVGLTCARSNEARGARWGEVDMESATWTVPASRMKGGVEHRVALSSQAMDVLRRARGLDDGSGLIFPSPVKRGKLIDAKTLRNLFAAAGVDSSVHGLRASFRMWCAEQADVSYLAAETALAHTVGGSVERSYRRGDLLERRRPLMQAWGEYIEGETVAS